MGKCKGTCLQIYDYVYSIHTYISYHTIYTLVITYHPLLRDFASVIRKHLYILYLSKEVKEIFTPGPMVSFRGARKLGSYLVRAKLHPIKRSVRSFKCNGKRAKFV